jgi:hypothetical protein
MAKIMIFLAAIGLVTVWAGIAYLAWWLSKQSGRSQRISDNIALWTFFGGLSLTFVGSLVITWKFY